MAYQEVPEEEYQTTLAATSSEPLVYESENPHDQSDVAGDVLDAAHEAS